MGRLMKDSGIPWIGEIPADWQVFKTKNLMQNKSKRGYPNEQVLSLYRDYGVIPKDSRNDNHNITSEDTGSYKLVDAGDFVINKMKAWQGSMGVSNYRGIISPAYYVCSFKKDGLYKGYIHYLLRNEAYKPEYRRLSTGMRVGQWDLNIDDFLSIPCILPSSISEQRKIADFLDRKCKEVDELIALEEKMIAELKAYKQSVITETVTKGLNPDVPMKDSGIEWIGQIPAHWEIRRLKNRATQIFKGNGITKEDIVENGDSPCVRYGEIYSKYNYYFEHCITKTNKSRVASKQYFSYGDLLFAGTGELVEEIGKAIVYLGNEECLAGGDIIILKHNENPLYLSYALNCQHAQAQKSCSKAKLKVVHISADDIANIMTVFPPIEEQTAIAGFLRDLCMSIDSLISIKQSKIAELQDYKKSIIYEYATGKKEVPTL